MLMLHSITYDTISLNEYIMPRKPRIEIAGYYHIVNRGVEERVVFKEPADYENLRSQFVISSSKHGRRY